jgi:hypothetical protein
MIVRMNAIIVRIARLRVRGESIIKMLMRHSGKTRISAKPVRR